jgi:hypothetical protein
MINNLTKEQEEKIPVYLNKWLEKGLSTERLNFDEVRKQIHWLYDTFLKDHSGKPMVLILDSPMQCLYAWWMLKNSQLDSQLYSQLRSQLNSQLNSELNFQLNSQLNSQLRSQLSSQLYSQLRSQLSSQLDSQLSSQLDLQLNFQLYSQLNSELNSQLDSQLSSQLSSQLNSELNFQLYSQLNSELNSQLDSQLNFQLYSQLSSQLSPQLSSELYSQLDSQLSSQLSSQLNSELLTRLSSQLYSQLSNRWSPRYWWSGYYVFYDYLNSELLPNINIDNLNNIIKFSQTIPIMFPYKNICFVSQPPVEISRKGITLHNEKDLAVKFNDGWGMYALNGIRMDKKYIESKAQDISITDLMKEQNVDVRREVLRKVGLERFIKETKGKCLDKMIININNKKCEYQLLEISFNDNITARVLKMDNPSIDAMHVEGVEDTCNTVKEALAWRNCLDKYIKPKQLT